MMYADTRQQISRVCVYIYIYIKAVPEWPRGFQEVKVPRVHVKVVSLMHRPPLPPGNTPGTHFC